MQDGSSSNQRIRERGCWTSRRVARCYLDVANTNLPITIIYSGLFSSFYISIFSLLSKSPLYSYKALSVMGFVLLPHKPCSLLPNVSFLYIGWWMMFGRDLPLQLFQPARAHKHAPFFILFLYHGRVIWLARNDISQSPKRSVARLIIFAIDSHVG